MAYATPADVRAVLVPGGGDEPSVDPATAASVSDDEINQAISKVSALVDARLTGSYATPFNPTPPLITNLIADLAAYEVTLTFLKSKDFDTALDPVYLRGQAANRLLDQLADGTVTLDSQESDITVVNQFDSLFDTQDWRTSCREVPRGW